MADLLVECRRGDGDRVPVRFRSAAGGAVREVTEVVDRWPGEGHRYFRVRADDGATYVLRHDEEEDRWEIAYFESDRGG